MNIRSQFLATNLQRYLARRAAPRSLEGSEKREAREDEIAALLNCLNRFAPRDGLKEWWGKFEAEVAQSSTHRAWPSEGDIAAAARSVRGPKNVTVAQGDELDPLAIMGKRMAEGEAVGEGHFYGRLAVDLLRAGHVTQDILRKYRSAWYFRMKDVYGEETARDMERTMQKRQADAERLDDEIRHERSIAQPQPKRVGGYEWEGE